MFKRTRRKIVASIMAILIFVFAAILALIYGSSYYEAMNRNREMLESHADFFLLQIFLIITKRMIWDRILEIL